MSLVGLTNFITASNARGRVQQRLHNANVGQKIFYALDDDTSQVYLYLGFIYQGATKNRTGDNMESTLVLANNQIAMDIARRAVDNRWQVRVDTCIMDPETFDVQRTIAIENWIAATMAYDFETIEITLSSSIDAVGANSPNRVLTQSMVGALPTTGQIRNR